MRAIKNFTLTELITAMAVLIVLMLALINFFTAAQSAWTESAKRGEIFESANVVFDTFSRDIQAILPGGNTFYYYKNTDGVDSQVAFVTSSPFATNNTYSSPYFEVQYFVDKNTGVLKRSSMTDATSSGSGDWDFCTNPNWYNTAPGYDDLMHGVYSFTVTPFTSSGTPFASATTDFPYGIKCDMIIMDGNSYEQYKVLPGYGTPSGLEHDSGVAQEFRKRIARKFTQIYYLGDRQ